MQRDILLLTEMVDAAEQAEQLTAGITVSQLDDPSRTAPNRVQEEPLNWPFTVYARQRAEGTVFASGGSGNQIPSAQRR
jgi:hypothetical protein